MLKRKIFSLSWLVLSNWKILRYSTTSSHNMISFSLTSKREATQHQPCSGRYNLSRANWEEFQLSLTRHLEPTNSPITDDRKVEKLAKSITCAIHRAATASIPRKPRTSARGVVWWTPLLSDLKRMVYAARKSYQYAWCSSTDNIESSLSDYHRIWRIYTNAIHGTKRERVGNSSSQIKHLPVHGTWSINSKFQKFSQQKC